MIYFLHSLKFFLLLETNNKQHRNIAYCPDRKYHSDCCQTCNNNSSEFKSPSRRRKCTYTNVSDNSKDQQFYKWSKNKESNACFSDCFCNSVGALLIRVFLRILAKIAQWIFWNYQSECVFLITITTLNCYKYNYFNYKYPNR